MLAVFSRLHANVFGLGLFILSTLSLSAHAESNRWGRDYIPNVPVVTQDGKTLNFYDDVIAGRRLVISFIFTSCREMCPLITARLTQVYDALGPMAGRDIQFVSISVDPANDTPAKMKEHADAFRVGPGWLFLTGAPDDIKLIRHRLGDRAANILDHRQDIWLVNEAKGDWQRDSAFNDAAVVVHNIHAMATRPAGEPMRPTPRGASPQIVTLPGQSLYDKACAACHTIGGGTKVGPDLGGIQRRRPTEWLTAFIRDPDRMRRSGDPVATTLSASFKGVRMPNLGLGEQDARDLLAYIEARTFAAENPGVGVHAHHHGAQPARAQDTAQSSKPQRAPKSGHAHHH